MSKFIITDNQIEELKPYMPNVDESINKGLGGFLIDLDDLIVSKLEFFDNDYHATDTSNKLQKIYDEIYNQN